MVQVDLYKTINSKTKLLFNKNSLIVISTGVKEKLDLRVEIVLVHFDCVCADVLVRTGFVETEELDSSKGNLRTDKCTWHLLGILLHLKQCK